jgi:hypothetical protein
MEVEMRVATFFLAGLLMVGVRASHSAQPATAEEKVSSAVRSVEACYAERVNTDAVQGLSPMRFEISIRNECADYETSLKNVSGTSVDQPTQTSILRDVRQKSVVKYFDTLSQLHPRFKGACPDKSYSCIIGQR